MSDMHTTLFNAYNDGCIDKRFDITELEYLFYDLRSVLLSDRSKHSADIVASKAVILPRLDRIREILSSYQHTPKTCAECPLRKRDEDLRVANETLERMCTWLANPVHHDSLVSYDEAENLRKIFQENYTKER